MPDPYVIVVPHLEVTLKEFPENPHRCVIGPFATKDEAATYLTASGSRMPCKIARLVAPVDQPDDDADLED